MKLCILSKFPSVAGFPGGAGDKKLTCQCRRHGHVRCRFNPWVRKILWRRVWQPILVFLPGESYGQKESVGLQSMGSQRVRDD